MKLKLFLSLALFSALAMALPEDSDQPIEVEAGSVIVDESTGFNEFTGNAIVTQGSLLLMADLIHVQTKNEEVVSMVARGSLAKPAKYTQSQENQARFIKATATQITYEVNEGMIFLVGNARLVQGFDSFSGETLDYDIDNDKVIVKSSEDGTERVRFKIVL